MTRDRKFVMTDDDADKTVPEDLSEAGCTLASLSSFSSVKLEPARVASRA